MKRFKAATGFYLANEDKILYDECGTCIVHGIHNEVKDCMDEQGLVGHAHATSYIFGLDSKRKLLHQALRTLVDQELETFPGEPPATFTSHVSDCLDATALRVLRVTRANASDDSADSAIRQKTLIERLLPLKVYCNGDVRKPRASHFCNLCCLNAEGVTTRETQVGNMVWCLYLLLGALFSGEKPALNRWLSVGKLLGYICAGFFFYNILPRAWAFAFGEGEVPTGPLDSWHTYVKSKVRRVCTWFRIEETEATILMYVTIAGPAEHLMQVVQERDAVGAQLRDLLNERTNPFWCCILVYAEMLIHPLRHQQMRALWFHASQRGLAYCANMRRVVVSLVLMMASAIWRQCAMPSFIS